MTISHEPLSDHLGRCGRSGDPLQAFEDLHLFQQQVFVIVTSHLKTGPPAVAWCSIQTTQEVFSIRYSKIQTGQY